MNDEVETLIERAIETETPFSFRYTPPKPVPGEDDPPRRVVSPYELKESTTGKTLLVCWSHGSEGIRAFDVSRITGFQSEAGSEEFVHPVESD